MYLLLQAMSVTAVSFVFKYVCFDVLNCTFALSVKEFLVLFLHLKCNLIQAESLVFALQSWVCQCTVVSLVRVVTGATEQT